MAIETTEQSTDQTKALEGSTTSKTTSFLGHAAIYGIGAVAMQLASIFLLPLYTSKLTPAEYGILQLLYRIGDILNICLLFNGIRLASLNFWCKAETPEERRTVPASIATLVGLIFLVGVLIVFLISEPLANFFQFDDPNLIVCGIIAIMLQGLGTMPLALMQARTESIKFLTASLGITITQISLVVYMVAFLDMGVWGVVLGLGITHGLFGVILLGRELIMNPYVPDTAQLLEMLRFSAPFVPTGLCFFLLNSGDQFFLAKYSTTTELGIYALAYRLMQGVGLLAFQPLMQVWSAKMYSTYREPNASILFGRAITRIISAFVILGTAVLLLRRDILSLLADPAYAGAAQLLVPLLLAQFFMLMANLVDGAFWATRKNGWKPIIAAGSSTIIFLAYWFLIPAYEAMGAAYATLIGFTFHFVLTVLVSRRVFVIELERKRLLALLGVCCLTFAAGEFFPSTFSYIPLRLALSLVPIIWIACSRIMLPDERQFFHEAIRQFRTRLMAG